MSDIERHLGFASRIQFFSNAAGRVSADNELSRQPRFSFIKNEADDVRFPIVIQILFVQIADRRIVDQRDTKFAFGESMVVQNGGCDFNQRIGIYLAVLLVGDFNLQAGGIQASGPDG